MSEYQDWKKKCETLSLCLQEKERTLKEYQEAIQQSNQLMKEVMDKLSVELKMAHRIHRILLPVDLPIIEGCEFSFKFQPAEVEKSQSKDFYEVVPHPPGRSFGIIMSSCSSYSLSACVFSARLKMMNRGEKAAYLKPHEFITSLIKEMDLDMLGLSKVWLCFKANCGDADEEESL